MISLTDAEEVRVRIARMSKCSKTLYVIAIVFICITVCFGVAFFGFAIYDGVETGKSPVELVSTLISVLVFFCIGIALLCILARAFRDVSKAQSPFTLVQAKRIGILGILLLANAVLEAVVSVVPLHIAIGEAKFDYISSPGMFLDAMSIIAAIVCFCLSYVFRYGALLQWLNDESL